MSIPTATRMLAAGVTFDVSALSDSDYRKGNRKFHLLGLGAFIITGIAWMAALVTVVVRGGLVADPTFNASMLGGIGCSVVLFGWLGMMMSPGATQVQVSGRGIRLTYPRGRTTEFDWTDPKVKLTLYEFPRILPSGLPFPFSPLWLVTRHPQSNPLTAEAFDAILTSAKSAGLLVSRIESSFGTPRSVVRIRAPKSPAR